MIIIMVFAIVVITVFTVIVIIGSIRVFFYY